jgi:hypothetical protein
MGQMFIWASKKHRAYKKEFGDKYPRNRKAMIPFIFWALVPSVVEDENAVVIRGWCSRL